MRRDTGAGGGICPYCNGAGGHTPECPTQFVTEKRDSRVKHPGVAVIRKEARKSIEDDYDGMELDHRSSIDERLAQYRRWSKGEVDEERQTRYPDWSDVDFKIFLSLRENPLAICDRSELRSKDTMVRLFEDGLDQYFVAHGHEIDHDQFQRQLREYITAMLQSIMEQKRRSPLDFMVAIDCQDRQTYNVSVECRAIDYRALERTNIVQNLKRDILTYTLDADWRNPSLGQTPMYTENVREILHALAWESYSIEEKLKAVGITSLPPLRSSEKTREVGPKTGRG